jgi:hypothetical protein
MMFASSASLRAEESGSNATISAAFSSKNYGKALVLVREAFANLKPSQSVEAATLIRSVLPSAPIDESGAVLVAAIQGNPSLGKAILDAAVSDASRPEQLVMLSRLNFAANQDPQSFGSISQSVPKMINGVQGKVPVSMVLTSPAYNPANSLSFTKVFNSPSDIRQDEKDIRKDERDINQDDHQLAKEREQLRDDIAQLIKDLKENMPPSVIKAEEAKINAEEKGIVATENDLKSDRKDLKADEKDLRQDLHGRPTPSPSPIWP